MDRRHFLSSSHALLLAMAGGAAARAVAASERLSVNLVPERAGSAPNYWCTWGAQTAMAMLKRPDAAAMNAEDLTLVIENYINEQTVFGPDGWARSFFPKIRKDLYFMYDGGWSTTYQSFVADEKKFPSFTGAAHEVVHQMNSAVQRQGWRGAALWCRDTPGGASDVEIMQTLRLGRIGYVKIDVGDPNFHLTSLRDSLQLRLTLEHVSGVDGGLNGNPAKEGRYPPLRSDGVQAHVLEHTDVYRIYDLQGPVDLPTAIDRVSQSIRVVEGNPRACALINAEHETYLAATLGCTVGIMQHPPFQKGNPVNLDHVTRAVRWQRLAAPMAAGYGFLRLDDNILTDEWQYSASDSSYAASSGTVVRQGAPARVTRNLELPAVVASGEAPFVLASRFHNGAIAVAALPRVQIGRAAHIPPASVTLDVMGASGPIGVFGRFESLTLVGRSFSTNARVLAQDLAGDRAIDITHLINVSKTKLEIPGNVIERVGLADATAGDQSLPGLVVRT